MAASGAAYVIITDAVRAERKVDAVVDLGSGRQPGLCLALDAANFNDYLAVRRWHGALWLIFSASALGFMERLAVLADIAVVRCLWWRLLLLALSAIVQTVRTVVADLVAFSHGFFDFAG